MTRLTLTGVDTCTRVGMVRRLVVTDKTCSVTDNAPYDSGQRPYKFTRHAPPADAEDLDLYAPHYVRGTDCNREPYTVVEWAGEWHHGHGYNDELRIQVWDKEPYELYTVMIVLERRRSGAYKESRGPIFTLDEECKPKWDAFLKELKEAHETQHQAIA